MAIKKERLDARAQALYPDLSRNQIQSLIVQGKVFVNGVPVTKPGTPIAVDVEITVKYEELKYASRAGFKLEAALDHFKIDPQDLVILDAGISTGGFTSCLLKRGAKRVYGVDVGYGQVHESVRNDPRLVLLERTNLRHLDALPELVDLVTLDLSFISILKVMPAIKKLIKPDGKIITLIKPQFEATRADIGTGGIITDPKVHARVVEDMKAGMHEFGFEMVGVIDSPILGATGNKEFLALFVPSSVK